MYTNVCATREIYKKVKKKLYFSSSFCVSYHIYHYKNTLKYTPCKNYENFMNLYVSLKDKKYFEPLGCI